MAKILVVAELKATGTETREMILEKLITVSKYSIANEPGVTKYMLCAPADDSAADTVWAIEEYDNKEVFDAHMAAEPVKDLINFMSSDPSPLGGAPTIHYLSYLEDMVCTKDTAATVEDPYIVFGTVKFAQDKRDSTLQYWAENLQSSQNESGCVVYSFAKADDKPDVLYTLEVYESEKYLTDVHVPSQAVQETIEKTKDVREDLVLAKLKLRGGFVYKKP